MKKKAAIITLGCAKNTVDSELIASILESEGVQVDSDPENADAVLVNTCGFIGDAREESIDAILEAAALKGNGGPGSLIVSGCLSKRYADELAKDMPEIDLLAGVDPHRAAAAVLCALGLPPHRRTGYIVRNRRFTPRAWAYLRISDGCSNRCSYCAIPDIRGPLVSRPMDEVLHEFEMLVAEGVKEINIIAQDTTSYMLERGRRRLHELLDRACRRAPAGVWLRLLYTHPAHYTDELIEVLSTHDRICPYLDIPIQHASDAVLRDMGRGIGRRGLAQLMIKLRSVIPHLVVRTSVMVGYPTETDADFEELLGFIGEMRFERLGAFMYSSEEGTPAAKRHPDSVPPEVKRERYHRLMCTQREIAFRHAAGRKGEVVQALLDDAGAEGSPLRSARGRAEAPEVDPVLLVKGAGDIPSGKMIKVKITGADGYDCLAEAAGS